MNADLLAAVDRSTSTMTPQDRHDLADIIWRNLDRMPPGAMDPDTRQRWVIAADHLVAVDVMATR